MKPVQQHTPGPWRHGIENGQVAVFGTKVARRGASKGKAIGHTVAVLPHETIKLDEAIANADARLIAAAPDGLIAAIEAYRALLRLPLGSIERVHNDKAMALLRNFIADATGQDEQDVQKEFEQAESFLNAPAIMSATDAIQGGAS